MAITTQHALGPSRDEITRPTFRIFNSHDADLRLLCIESLDEFLKTCTGLLELIIEILANEIALAETITPSYQAWIVDSRRQPRQYAALPGKGRPSLFPRGCPFLAC